MHKIVKIILAVIGLIGTVLMFKLPGTDVPADEAVNNGAMHFMFIISYLLLAVAIGITVVFGFMHLFTSKGGLKRALIAIGGFFAVMLISYLLATGTDVSLDEMARLGVPTTEGEVKTIGMGLNASFLLTIIAIGALLLGGVKKMTGK